TKSTSKPGTRTQDLTIETAIRGEVGRNETERSRHRHRLTIGHPQQTV
ncbi:unnamed protein product, partial [Didymodactylos carnosus]